MRVKILYKTDVSKYKEHINNATQDVRFGEVEQLQDEYGFIFTKKSNLESIEVIRYIEPFIRFKYKSITVVK